MKKALCIALLFAAIVLIAATTLSWHYYGSFIINIPDNVSIVNAYISDGTQYEAISPTAPLTCSFTKGTPVCYNELEVHLSNGEIRSYTLVQTDETVQPPNGVPPVCRQIRLSLSGPQFSVPYDPTVPQYD